MEGMDNIMLNVADVLVVTNQLIGSKKEKCYSNDLKIKLLMLLFVRCMAGSSEGGSLRLREWLDNAIETQIDPPTNVLRAGGDGGRKQGKPLKDP